MPRKKLTPDYAIIPLNARTGKPRKRIKSGDRIMWGFKTPSGIKPIHVDNPGNIAVFYKKDMESLNRDIQKRIKAGQNPKNFVAYEQITRNVARDYKGRKIKKEDGNPRRLVRLTGSSKKFRQRGSLFVGGTWKRYLDLGFQPYGKRNKVNLSNFKLVKPGKNHVYHIQMQWTPDSTLKDILHQLVVDMSQRKMSLEHRKRIFYNWTIKVTDGNGVVQAVIPGSSSVRVRRPSKKQMDRGAMPRDQLSVMSLRDPTNAMKKVAEQFQADQEIAQAYSGGGSTLADIYTDMSKDIRQSLAQQKLRWTHPEKLDEFAASDPESGEGRYFMIGNVDVENLEQIQSDWTLDLYLQFEFL